MHQPLVLLMATTVAGFVLNAPSDPHAADLGHMLIDFRGKADSSKANRRVCYDTVGCFDNQKPFDNALHFLPDSPGDVGTEFRLFTRSNINSGRPDIIDYASDKKLITSSYRRSRPVKFSLHGFAQNADADWMVAMAHELLRKDDMNVILVNWKNGAAAPNYPQAVANVRLVGRQIALLVTGILQFDSTQTLDQVHCIGHSLGAHVCGMFGRDLKGKVGRVTGLDPAGPFFESKDPQVRLDESDAKFVDAMHTNGAPFSRGGAGTLQAMAHIDVYVDGGQFQSGCPNPYLGALKDLIRLRASDIGNVAACSHMRAHDLYVQSINPSCDFNVYPCSTYEQFSTGQCLRCGSEGCLGLGYRLDPATRVRGKLFANSFSSVPHCAHHFGVSLRIPVSSGKDIQGKLSVQLRGTDGYTHYLSITKKKKVPTATLR